MPYARDERDAPLLRNRPSPPGERVQLRLPRKRFSSSPAGRWRARSATIVEANGLDHIELTCLPAIWHNRPEKIAPGVRDLIRENRAALQDDRRRLRRMRHAGAARQGLRGGRRGAHRRAALLCLLLGQRRLRARGDDDIDAFFLTDFLARQFESFVIEPLGLDRHPELRDMYFGNYRRLDLPRAERRRGARGEGARGGGAARARGSRSASTGMGDLPDFLTAV